MKPSMVSPFPEREQTMSGGQLLVFSRAKSGRDAEFNRWYSEQHIPDTLRLAPEIHAAHRFTLNAIATVEGTPAWQYLTIYEIDAAQVPAVLERMNGAMGTAAMPMSDTADLSVTAVLHATPLA